MDEFCDAHNISRSQLYKMWKMGMGPRFMRAGIKRLITNEVDADWRHMLEAEQQTARLHNNTQPEAA